MDMIPPPSDNGEPNSTMANQIVYTLKETILMRIVAHKWCHLNAKLNGVQLFWSICFGTLRPLSTANVILDRFILSTSYCVNESM